MAQLKQRGSVRVKGNRIELRAYAGVDPTTGKKDWKEDRLPLDATEKQIGVALTALVAKADALAATRRARRRGEIPPEVVHDPNRTVAASLEAWWKRHGRHRARSADARMVIDAYLIPSLGDVALWRLHPGLDSDAAAANPDMFDLSDLFASLAKTGSVGGGGRRHTAGGPLGSDTLQKIKDVLSAALALDVASGQLSANPCSGLKLPTAGTRRSSTPDRAEMTAFLPYLAGGGYTSGGYTVTRRVRGSTDPTATVTYRVPTQPVQPTLRDRQLLVYARLVASGPRPTEVSALQRGNYDRATSHMAFLGEGVVKVKEQGEPERWELATGETDKRRKRVIELDPLVVADLNALLLEQDEVALAHGVKLGRRAYLFSSDPDCSTFLTPNTAGDGFAAAIARARADGVDLPPAMRLYDMRHYGITYLLRAGAAPAAVAVRFATSEAMIRSRYSHAISGDDAHLAEKMSAVWPRQVTPSPVASITERQVEGQDFGS